MPKGPQDNLKVSAIISLILTILLVVTIIMAYIYTFLFPISGAPGLPGAEGPKGQPGDPGDHGSTGFEGPAGPLGSPPSPLGQFQRSYNQVGYFGTCINPVPPATNYTIDVPITFYKPYSGDLNKLLIFGNVTQAPWVNELNNYNTFGTLLYDVGLEGCTVRFTLEDPSCYAQDTACLVGMYLTSFILTS